MIIKPLTKHKNLSVFMNFWRKKTVSAVVWLKLTQYSSPSDTMEEKLLVVVKDNV